MPEVDLEKTKNDIVNVKNQLKEIKHELTELEEIFDKPTDSKTKEERRFQIELLKIQQGSDVFGSIIAVIASIFVALITTSLTLVASLSAYISVGISVSLIIWEIVVALLSLAISWRIGIFFRDRRIKEIEGEFGIEKKQKQTKPS